MSAVRGREQVTLGSLQKSVRQTNQNSLINIKAKHAGG